MFACSGSDFSMDRVRSRIQPNSQYVSANVAGRTCISYTGAVQGSCELGHGGPDTVQGGCSFSTAAVLRAIVSEACVVFPVMSTATDWTLKIGYVMASNAGNSAAITAYVHVAMSGGTATAFLRWSRAGTDYDVILGEVVGGTTFYKLKVHFFRDRIKVWWDGVAKDDIVYVNWTNEVLYPHSLYFFWDEPGTILPAWDYVLQGTRRVSYSATLGESETNGHNDNGRIWFIAKAALAGLVTGGGAFLASIVDGAYTFPALADGDHLAVKVLDGGADGYAFMMNLDTGVVTIIEWTP